VRVSVCTTVVHNTARSSSDCLPSVLTGKSSQLRCCLVDGDAGEPTCAGDKARRGGEGRLVTCCLRHSSSTDQAKETTTERQTDRERERERERERGSRVIHKHSCVVQRLDGDESRATLNFVNNHRDALLARADNESARRRCIHRRTSCRGSDVPLHTACSM